MIIKSQAQSLIALMLVFAACCSGVSCGRYTSGTDCSADGSVWLEVCRISEAERLYQTRHGHYGPLLEMTDLVDGLPASVTAGQMGSYKLWVDLNKDGYIARAEVVSMPRHRRRLPSFYADQTGKVRFDRSGKRAGPWSESMDPRDRTATQNFADVITGLLPRIGLTE
jgi:hypothetical protein